jgi:tRNA A-37 threonylcarbamoyl transferase component Bud32
MQSAVTTLDELARALVETGRLDETQSLRKLTGGVSALVAVVEGGEHPWVVKAPLERLTVKDEWIVDQRRGENEAAVLALLQGRLGPIRTPLLHFYDSEHLLLGEEFIPPPTVNFKDELLEGRGHPDVNRRIGEAIAVLHRIEPPLSLCGPGPQNLFEDLRIDPFYRVTASRRPELRDDLESLIIDTVGVRERTLVHGDLSPKNILVTSTMPVLLDWEVIHVGDPAFDVGMMSAHLFLKALHHGARNSQHPVVASARLLWRSYDGPAPNDRSIRHVGGVMAARLYGKSPVEYLVDATSRERAHRIARAALSGRITEVDELFGLIDED